MSYDIDRKLIYREVFEGLSEIERKKLGLSEAEAQELFTPRTIYIYSQSTGDFFITMEDDAFPRGFHLTRPMIDAMFRNEEIQA